MCVCMFVCLSFIGGQTVGWNEMKLGMSDPWDMRTDIGGSSLRSKVTGLRGQGHRVASISQFHPIETGPTPFDTRIEDLEE